jgi:ATP-dependent Clp protease ATP-binding subunit ClpA
LIVTQHLSRKPLQEVALPVFTRDLEKSLRRSLDIAKEQRLEKATLEHLLLALLDDKDVVNMLIELNIDINGLKSTVTSHIEDTLATRQTPLSDEPTKALITLNVERPVARACVHAQSSGIHAVSGPHVLLFIFSGEGAYAEDLLNKFGVTKSDVETVVQRQGRL